MNAEVSIQSATAEPVPEDEDIRRWIASVLQAITSTKGNAELCVRLVGTDEMSQLNAAYRGKQGPTNVLSFPADLPDDVSSPLLGDIVICAPVIAREADEQGKNAKAHWAHMAVHGTLHLLGYDHIAEQEAQVMEALETRILNNLNFPCPYEGQTDFDEKAP